MEINQAQNRFDYLQILTNLLHLYLFISHMSQNKVMFLDALYSVRYYYRCQICND
ncbi:MAG: hypothetical protein RLZZ267_633 [Bacillota bacterium]|jgi:hypothetical protein